MGYDGDDFEFGENASHDKELEDSFEEGVLFCVFFLFYPNPLKSI